MIHVVSGGTGSSAERVAKTVLAQFPEGQVRVKVHAEVRDTERLEEVMAEAESESESATVVHSMVAATLRAALVRSAERRGLAQIDLVGPLLDRLGWVLAQNAAGEPGKYRALHAEYFTRVEAMEYAVEHDDGRRAEDWHRGDVLLVGTSRVGKTPICMVLASHGWKAANLPLVREISLPPELFRMPPGKVVGLTIDPLRLSDHRRVRAQALGLRSSTDYDRYAEVEEDVRQSRLLYRRYGFAVVDVTDRPMEELARAVMERVRR